MRTKEYWLKELSRKKKAIKIPQRQVMFATSGEVFYTEHGTLKRMETREEFEAMIEAEQILHDSYFELTTPSGHYKIQVANQHQVIALIKEIKDIMEQARQRINYFNKRRDLGI
jgi:hypothetical protein